MRRPLVLLALLALPLAAAAWLVRAGTEPPPRETVALAGATACRERPLTVSIDGAPVEAYGLLCRELGDAEWTLVADADPGTDAMPPPAPALAAASVTSGAPTARETRAEPARRRAAPARVPPRRARGDGIAAWLEADSQRKFGP